METTGDRVIRTQGEGILVMEKRFEDLQPRAYLMTLLNFESGPPLPLYSRIDDLLRKYEGRRILLEMREVPEHFTAEEESHGC